MTKGICTQCGRNPMNCVVPPYIFEKLADSRRQQVRLAAIENLQAAARLSGERSVIATLGPRLLKFAGTSPAGPAALRREIYTRSNQNPPTNGLPGKRVRVEGDPNTGDAATDEAYAFSGDTWKFYNKVFGRNSLDDQGMTLVSTVHAGKFFDNAFWNGMQMVYGDGDGQVFQRFTRSLDVVGHELSHGVVQFTSGLLYYGESGALNEHFADAFGIMVRQYKKGETAASSDWLIGKEVLVPAPTRLAIRSLKAPGKAYQNDPDLGDDPQPDHYANRYTGTTDSGGVHINSGIPNHAFYLAAAKVGGKPWENVGKVWYKVMTNLLPNSDFKDCAAECRSVGTAMETAGTVPAGTAAAIDDAWKTVGL